MLLSSFRLGESDNYPTKYTLYVALYDNSNIKQLKQDIWKYHYENGVKTSEEKLLSVLGKKEGGTATDFVRCDVGENVIYHNQYLITGIGNVIDLKNKKVLSEEKAKFIKASGDSLIFYTNDLFKGKFYSVFKLNTGKYEQVTDLMYHGLTGQDVNVDYELQNRRIWLYPPKKEKQLLIADAGFGEELLGAKGTVVIPVYWIDNWNFVFPYYPITKNKATLIEVNVKTGEQIKLGDINDMPKGPEPSYFMRDPDGNLLYVCPKGKEIVDIKAKTIKTLEYYHCGNKFDIQVIPGAAGRILKYKGLEIGKQHCEIKSVQDCKSAVALEKKMKMGDEVYAQGIGVWNVHTKKWSTLMVDNVASVIGWTEE
ncbi:MAG: hypothetical protein IAF38_10575 [Bacteroidia bacterium]|nr:hypothetical protein [Bacteroidia bacterium]